MTTVHAYTRDQVILDAPHKDLRRARAAALSIIPTTTGAAKASALVMPELKGKFDGIALRVPVPDVSLVDLTADVVEGGHSRGRSTPRCARQQAAGWRESSRCSEEPLVSIGLHRATVIRRSSTPSTMMIGEHTVKVLSWYDNEWGYSCRVIDVVKLIAGKL